MWSNFQVEFKIDGKLMISYSCDVINIVVVLHVQCIFLSEEQYSVQPETMRMIKTHTVSFPVPLLKPNSAS